MFWHLGFFCTGGPMLWHLDGLKLLTLLFSFFASNPSPGRKTQNNASEVRAPMFWLLGFFGCTNFWRFCFRFLLLTRALGEKRKIMRQKFAPQCFDTFGFFGCTNFWRFCFRFLLLTRALGEKRKIMRQKFAPQCFDTLAFLAARGAQCYDTLTVSNFWRFCFRFFCFYTRALGEKRKIMRQKFAPQCFDTSAFLVSRGAPMLWHLDGLELLTLLFSFFASNPSPGRKTQNNASEVRALMFDTSAFLAAPTSDAFIFVFCFLPEPWAKNAK